MQWNAEGVMRQKTELEHIMNKDNIDLICIQETHLQKQCSKFGPTSPVQIWLLRSPLPFHVRDIPSQISFHLSKTDTKLTSTSNSRNKTKPGIIPEVISRKEYQNNRPTLLQRQRRLFGDISDTRWRIS